MALVAPTVLPRRVLNLVLSKPPSVSRSIKKKVKQDNTRTSFL